MVSSRVHRAIVAMAIVSAMLTPTAMVEAAEETRLCVTIRSETPIEGDILAAVASGEASITIEAPGACAPVPAPTSAPSDLEPGPMALAALAVLPLAAETPAGYDRDRFRHWVDDDDDGCDTRDEVLIEESLTSVMVGPRCRLISGVWTSVYDGTTTTDASTLDIDHVVPLAEAWRSGAGTWTDGRRARFANDLGDERTLRAVTAGSNRSKGDKDPAAWLPPDEAYRCEYAADWVAIKSAWGLAVDVAEHEALARVLADCP